MKKDIQVLVEERRTQLVFVKAENDNEALAKARFMYESGEVVLDADDFDGEPRFTVIQGDDDDD